MASIYKTKRDLLEAIVTSEDVVLDVGFLGQGTTSDSPNWPHKILSSMAKEVYGLDLDLNPSYTNNPHYTSASAEDFSFNTKFSLIFAGDLIEHLSNPGKFLDLCRDHLAPGGRLVLTTPNAFNLFNLTEKLSKYEPTVNSDHTFYFNLKVLRTLLKKNHFKVIDHGYVYTLGELHHESFKKKVLNALYWLLSKRTDKFLETLVVVAQPL